jgi:hypothetical protein
VIDELIGQNARQRLTEVKRGLRSILDLLSRTNGGVDDFQLAAPAMMTAARARTTAASRGKPARGKPAPPRNGSARSSSARRSSRR